MYGLITNLASGKRLRWRMPFACKVLTPMSALSAPRPPPVALPGAEPCFHRARSPTLSDGDDRDADQEEGQIQGPGRQEDDGRHTGPFGASETCRFTIRLQPPRPA